MTASARAIARVIVLMGITIGHSSPFAACMV